MLSVRQMRRSSDWKDATSSCATETSCTSASTSEAWMQSVAQVCSARSTRVRTSARSGPASAAS